MHEMQVEVRNVQVVVQTNPVKWVVKVGVVWIIIVSGFNCTRMDSSRLGCYGHQSMMHHEIPGPPALLAASPPPWLPGSSTLEPRTC